MISIDNLTEIRKSPVTIGSGHFSVFLFVLDFFLVLANFPLNTKVSADAICYEYF